MPEIEVASKHRAQPDSSDIIEAYEHIRVRDKANESLEQTEAAFQHLKTLLDKPAPYNLFRRLQQRRHLNRWLENQGYPHSDQAYRQLLSEKGTHIHRRELSAEFLDVALPRIRKTYQGLSDGAKLRGDALLRKYAPAEVIEACDTQAQAHHQEANVIEWMCREPNEESPYGATNEQLEAIILWNASHAETFASNPEATREQVNLYLSRIHNKADAGELDPVWKNVTPRISGIVIGDIMDPRFLGSTEGLYHPENHVLTFWPYELTDNASFIETIGHEVTHSLGGYETLWLTEGTTEMVQTVVNEDTSNGNVYPAERAAIQTLINSAFNPITFAEISKYYVGDNGQQNESRLAERLREAYNGYDVLGMMNNAYREILGDSGSDRRRSLHDAASCVSFTITAFAIQSRAHPQQAAASLREFERNTDDKVLRVAYRNAARAFESALSPAV